MSAPRGRRRAVPVLAFSHPHPHPRPDDPLMAKIAVLRQFHPDAVALIERMVDGWLRRQPWRWW